MDNILKEKPYPATKLNEDEQTAFEKLRIDVFKKYPKPKEFNFVKREDSEELAIILATMIAKYSDRGCKNIRLGISGRQVSMKNYDKIKGLGDLEKYDECAEINKRFYWIGIDYKKEK